MSTSNLNSDEQNPQNRRRSERVMLQVPITVQAETPTGEKVEEETHTVIVNAHGGLMKLKADVMPGQPMILVNPRTKAQQGCRVVRVDQPPGGVSMVAFEFDEAAPQFWPVVFPPQDWNLKRS